MTNSALSWYVIVLLLAILFLWIYIWIRSDSNKNEIGKMSEWSIDEISEDMDFDNSADNNNESLGRDGSSK